ncbi:hypothetical protein TRVA0_006S04038 [Trichomonascus vanleenenianus]|uniref:Mra1p n=1 Tax=Trichomonascus vanleenenianus TaxID=2268995 RepID=UPI003EC9E704
MRASSILLNAAKKNSFKKKIPVEVWPLFGAMGFVLFFATYSMGKKFTTGELRTGRQGPREH